MRRPKPIDWYYCGRRYGSRRITGVPFGVRSRGRLQRYVVTLCDCGKLDVIRLGKVQSQRTCLDCQNYRLRKTGGIGTRTHGQTDTPEYRTWTGMKERCCNSRKRSFKDYGGRGIRVCDRWLNSFESFLTDMGPKPSSAHSIDRINNDGNYEPGNCRWATASQQARNKRPRQKRATSVAV